MAKHPKLVKPEVNGVVDFDKLSEPTVIRRNRAGIQEDEYDEEMLDIPAFLRRQAD